MDNRSSLVIIHASAFFAPVLVPIIFMLVAKDREVKDIAIQALLFHIVLSLCLFISILLFVVLIGIPLLLFFSIVWVWYPIKGIIYAAKEEPFGYPIVARWAP